MTAKMKGKRYLSDTRSDWMRVRVAVMRWCLRIKLVQNAAEFGRLLLSTGSLPIVEHSLRDDFWGAKLVGGQLVGTNVLGRLLMELREELEGDQSATLYSCVAPPEIPDFRLYGAPIGRIYGAHPDSATPSGAKSMWAGARADSGIAEGQNCGAKLDERCEGEIEKTSRSGGKPTNRDQGCILPRRCKRLGEVDFPIGAVSRHAAREKSVRHGHPSTYHLWWARRPLASSRAVLLALLLPDPCDPTCPGTFKSKAREILSDIRQPLADDMGLRKALLWFVGEFANWDLATHPTYLRVGRDLVQAACGREAPLVVDPFAGGGSIPLEALRLGCEAFASDLNPVACLILKVMLEDLPRHGAELADELRRVGGAIKRQAKGELADLYPSDPDGATPIAYLWARTVRCDAPNCGAEIPLLRSFWLCQKTKRRRALRYRVERQQGEPPKVEFAVFRPVGDDEVPHGTVARARATCLCCGAVLQPERVRAQIAAQRGGAEVVFDDEGHRTGGARMTAVVTLRHNERGRHYRLPTEADYAAVRQAQERVASLLHGWELGGRREPYPVPDEPLPPIGTLGFRVQRYGMLQWGDLFTARQKAALLTVAKIAATLHQSSAARAVSALSVSRVADIANCLCRWENTKHQVRNLFTRQAIPLVWDFAEASFVGEQAGDHSTTLSTMLRVVDQLASVQLPQGQVELADATAHPLPDQSASVWFTDPPYYDAVPYADLSDFFLVWLKRTLPGHPLLQDPFDPANPLSPKAREAVQDETKQQDGRVKDRQWFEETMAKAFAEGRRVLADDGVGCVVFAHKTTEGWEALLSGMIRGGWTITGSWPIATEMATRLRARDSAALATSVHLICRPRPEDAPVGDWADVLRELPRRVADWMSRLQGEGIRGADLVFACIGPALEIYSRFRAVETAEGRVIGLPEYLEKVWEVVGRAALVTVLGTAEAQARNGMDGALEEDARLTALFLWTVQSTETAGEDGNGAGDEPATAAASAKGLHLPFDVVRRFAQPMGIDLDRWTGRIIEQAKGVVRLLPVAERAKDLLGDAGAGAAADWIEADPVAGLQRSLFPELDAAPRSSVRARGRRGIIDGDAELQAVDATTLDRLHAAMLLQANGHANALRALISAERERGPDFLRLANALSALYPRGGREKRLLDAMLLAVPR